MSLFLSLSWLLALSGTALVAQEIQINTRHSYYTTEKTAEILIHGKDATQVQSVGMVSGGTILPLSRPQPGLLAASMAIGNLPAGDNPLAVRLTLTNGQIVDKTFTLNRLPSRPNEVKVDRLTGGLWVNGLPFYPFGFYASFSLGDLLLQEVYNAMNLVGVYQPNDAETFAQRKAYMDQCAALGIKVNYGLNGLIGKPHDKPEAVMTPEEAQQRKDELRREVEAFKDHPALLAWYMNDEPDGQGRPPALLEEAYQIIRKADPYHPVSVVFVIPSIAGQFANSLDIAMTDPYPIPGDVNSVSEHMRQLKRHFQYSKALWLVPQAFGGGEYYLREPSGPEIRVMTYLGLLDNAMGIQYFIRRYPNLFPKSRVGWNEAVRAAHEVQMLLPWLFGGQGPEEVASGAPGVIARSWQHGGSTLIIAVNGRNEPANLALELPGGSGAQQAKLLFENRSVGFDGNQLRDMIDAFGVRVYVLEPMAEKTLAQQNLFVNPGFEHCYSPGVPFGCYASSSNNPRYDGATYFVESSTAHEGHNALRFTCPSDSSNLRLSFFRMLVQAGQVYRVALWARSAPAQEGVSFNVRMAELDQVQTFRASPEWQQFSFYVSTKADTKNLTLELEADRKGTFWVDQIEVFPDPLVQVSIQPDRSALVSIRSFTPGAAICYATKPNAADADFQPYTQPLVLKQYANLQVRYCQGPGSDRKLEVSIPLSKATLRDISIPTEYSPKYAAKGPVTLLDGEYGSLDFRDKKWIGFEGKDAELIIDLGQVQKIEQAFAHFLVSVRDGIHAPKSLLVESSVDGQKYQALGRADNPAGSEQKPSYYLELGVKGKARQARYLRFRIQGQGAIPEGFLFKGTNAWLFVDEVRVE